MEPSEYDLGTLDHRLVQLYDWLQPGTLMRMRMLLDRIAQWGGVESRRIRIGKAEPCPVAGNLRLCNLPVVVDSSLLHNEIRIEVAASAIPPVPPYLPK